MERILGRRLRLLAAPSCQVSGPLLASVFFATWEVWIPQVSPFSSEIVGTTSHIQKTITREETSRIRCFLPWVPTVTLGSLTGVGVKKLFIKSTLQKCSPTGLSHSENRKPTPISSEDHPMCPPPSTSCENAFMKFPQSQGQRAAPCRWGGMLGQEAHRLLTRRKINSGAGRVWIRNHWRNLPWEKALPK